MSSNRRSGFFAGALFGGLLGAGLTALLTPRSGEQIRDELADWRAANRAKGEPGGTPAELIEAGASLIRASLERVQVARESARQASEEASRRLWQEWVRRLAGVSGDQFSEDRGQGW